VNGISAGPIKTLAASGVKGFKGILGAVEEKTPLRRNVTTGDVGGAALFLCSELANGVTGEIMYVDAGYNIMGL
jgi:enoyl-[acyl-carrier protein] reductase I